MDNSNSYSIKLIYILLVTFSVFSIHGCDNINCNKSCINKRLFIAHRGVNIKNTIAGENSIEAVTFAKRAGFQCIETDVRLTADSVLIVMHDNTLNRTCLNADGSKLKENIYVSELTFQELKSNYILKATEIQNRTSIPTLEEFLIECKHNDLIPFIEPKLYDETGKHYKDIINMADKIFGKNNYIITSNNRANIVIRKVGLNDVKLMGILYQTTFQEIENLENIIMAISTSQFNSKEFEFYVNKAKENGLQTESHADNFKRFAMINNHDIDYVSTDLIAPDLNNDQHLLKDFKKLKDFKHSGKIISKKIHIEKNDTLTLKQKLPEVHFGGIYLEINVKGHCDIELANQKFSIENFDTENYNHQLLLYNSAPDFKIIAKEKCEICSIHIKLAEF